MSIRLQELITTLVEQTIDIACTCKCLIIAIGIQLCQFATIILKLNIWRIANNNVKTIADPEHPFRVEEVGNCILVIWISIRELLSISRCKVFIISQQVSQFFTKFFVLPTQCAFTICSLGDKMLMANCFKFVL